MSRLLLDTQILIWYQTNHLQLSDNARLLLLNAEYELLVSAATWWEMAIKISSGKLTIDLPTSMAAAIQRGIETLPLRPQHFLQVSTLPYPDLYHRDPFDRLLVAQA